MPLKKKTTSKKVTPPKTTPKKHPKGRGPQTKDSVSKYDRARNPGPMAPKGLSLSIPWEIQVQIKRKTPRLNRAAFVSRAEAILFDLERPAPHGIRSRGMKPFPPPEVRQLSVSFIGDKEMHLLNRAYRGKDKPTDVLSFAALEGLTARELSAPGVELALGDLVISLDTAVIQAKRYRWSESEEILRLLIHGILHLLGYDHERVAPREAQLMRRVERRLFKRHRGLAGTLLTGGRKSSSLRS